MTPKRLFCASALLASSALMSMASNAAEFTVKVTNLTHGMYFTPLLATAHSDQNNFFEVGKPATKQLEIMAEGGMTKYLLKLADGWNADSADNLAQGPLGPGSSTGEVSMKLTSEDNGYLSVVAMLLPTNDAFVGLNSWKIPTEPGTYTVMLNAYDAGTEANNEIVAAGGGVVATPENGVAEDDPNGPLPGFIQDTIDAGITGTGGTGLTDNTENKNVHIHRGGLGDDNATGGKSDLNNAVHRWLNPVARLTVTVK